MKLSELNRHSLDVDLLACKTLTDLLAEGLPVVYCLEDPKENADGVVRRLMFLVQIRTDLNQNKLSKIQARVLGFSPVRLVRTMLNIDPKVVETFPEDEQEMFKRKAVWENHIIRVQESTVRNGSKSKPKLSGGGIKTVNNKPVYERTVLAEINDEDEKDFFFTEFEIVEQVEEFKPLVDLTEDVMQEEDAELVD